MFYFFSVDIELDQILGGVSTHWRESIVLRELGKLRWGHYSQCAIYAHFNHFARRRASPVR